MEPLKQIKNIKTGTKIVNYVPYQKCPICDGTGIVSRPAGIPADVTNFTSSSVAFTCDVCYGSKIIPMHALIEHLEIKKKRRNFYFN